MRTRILWMLTVLVVAGLVGWWLWPQPPEPAPVPALACQSGAWQFDDGERFTLSPSGEGLRYRFADGRTGRFEADATWRDGQPLSARPGFERTGDATVELRPDPCAASRLTWRATGAAERVARRVPLRIEDVRFRSGDLTLAGRLVLPAQADTPLPLAVLVHGSERWSAVQAHYLQYLLPAHGIAAFVYDKRGTGASGGRYSQDFHALAGDAVAALAQARAMRPGGFSAAGYVGASQGGWVAPLAASRSEVDYVVALYGMADNALSEDRDQVANDLRQAGYGEDVVATARAITDATARLMASGFREGFDAVQAVRERYGEQPWFGAIRGEFSGEVLAIPGWAPQWIVRLIARQSDVGTSWDYEPVPVLAALAMPQLWVLAADDLEAPPAITLQRLRQLQAQGRPIDLAVFADTDHGIYRYRDDAGVRTPLRHPAGYLPLLMDWIRQRRFQRTYDGAELEPYPRADAAPSTAAADPSTAG